MEQRLWKQTQAFIRIYYRVRWYFKSVAKGFNKTPVGVIKSLFEKRNNVKFKAPENNFQTLNI